MTNRSEFNVSNFFCQAFFQNYLGLLAWGLERVQ